MCASAAYYGDNLTFIYAYDIRTSQETHLWASTTCYRDSFTLLYADDIRISQETHIAPPQPVTEITLLFACR
jgi:hypothetical protein